MATPHIRQKLKRYNGKHKTTRMGRDSLDGGSSGNAALNVCPRCGMPMSGMADALQKERLLFMRLLDDHEEFRASLAYEIHEGFAQQLVGALLHLQGFERLQHKSPTDARDNFCIGVELLRDSICETRRIVNRLRPPILNDLGILSAVNCLICEMTESYGPEIEFFMQGRLKGFTPQLESAAFRIIRELLENACRHSGSENVHLKVARKANCLQIEVRDWGAGFDPASVKGNCLGLQKVCRRVGLLGGQASIDTGLGQGTCVTVRLPLNGKCKNTPLSQSSAIHLLALASR